MAVELSDQIETICSGSDRRGNYSISRRENIQFAPGGKFYNEKNKDYGRYQYFLNRSGKSPEKIGSVEAMDYCDSLNKEEFHKFFR